MTAFEMLNLLLLVAANVQLGLIVLRLAKKAGS